MELIKINKIELASELAQESAMHEMMDDELIMNESDMFVGPTDGCTHYTDHAQDVFNRWYDYFLFKIEEVAR